MGHFAKPLPVSSHIVTLKLFLTQNLIWMSIAGYLAKVLSKVMSFEFQVLFSPIDRAKSCNVGSSPLMYDCLG
jgi:hypothetical protein